MSVRRRKIAGRVIRSELCEKVRTTPIRDGKVSRLGLYITWVLKRFSVEM